MNFASGPVHIIYKINHVNLFEHEHTYTQTHAHACTYTEKNKSKDCMNIMYIPACNNQFVTVCKTPFALDLTEQKESVYIT